MLTFDAAPDELQLFLQEAEEQLQLLDQDIVLLEKEGPREELLQEIFRAAHTLKGSSGAIGHTKMAKLTHAMENVLDNLRHGTAECSTEMIDVLLKSLDGLRLLKEEVETFQDCGFDPADLAAALNALVAPPSNGPKKPEAKPAPETPAAPGAAMPAPAAMVHDHGDPDGVTLSEAKGLSVHEEALRCAQDDSARHLHCGADEPHQAYHVIVRIAEDCPLMAARCLQVYLEASSFGRVVESMPSLASIEAQMVEPHLELVIQGVSQVDEMVKTLQDLPDILSVTCEGPERDEPASAEEDAATAEHEADRPSEGSETGVPAAAGPAAAPAVPAKSATSLGKTVRIDVARLDDLMNLVGELVIDRTRLTQLGTMLQSKYEDEAIGDLSETSQHIGRIVDELQESIMKARMLPVESLFNRLPRVVRDLAQRSGKKIDFVVEGRETELDRSVIEELNDPLVHLLRNCVDHGIEPPEKRAAAGKPEVGQIRLSAMHRENRILIRVQDDGAGIDPAKVKATAIKRGVLTAEAAERLSDQEAVELVFAPGFSTAEKVTDVSGRGVGMDIVRTNIEKLNGSVSIDTHAGKGTTFTLELPLTLAIIDALMVGVGDQILAIPLVSVMETLRVWRSEIQWVNKRQCIQLRETVLPLIALEKALALPSSQGAADRVFVVAVRVGDNRFGLVVDSLLGELQVVIKSLGRQVGTIAGVTGATILGDGRVALILDVPSLVKCVIEEQSKGWAA